MSSSKGFAYVCVSVPSSASSVSEFSPQSRKRRKLLFVRSDLPSETNVWLRVLPQQAAPRCLLQLCSSTAQGKKKKLLWFSLWALVEVYLSITFPGVAVHKTRSWCVPCFRFACVCFHAPFKSVLNQAFKRLVSNSLRFQQPKGFISVVFIIYIIFLCFCFLKKNSFL